MSKISNALTMLELLSTGRKYNINELSSILEVTPRMIRVYKEDFEKAGIYIDTIRGPYGGYILNQTIRVPSRKFKHDDYVLLNDVKTMINDEKVKKDLMILSDKIRGVFQGSKLEEQELKNETLKKYNLLTRAIKERRKVKTLYFSYDKGEIERIIQPYDMFLCATGWGVAAYCELRQDLRHFELKRMIKYELLDEFF